MSRRASTPDQIHALAHSEMQEALRASIGELTVTLTDLGITSILSCKEFQPIVKSWKTALEPQPQA